MRLICNSKLLAAQIKKAIQSNCDVIWCDTNRMCFQSNTKQELSFEVGGSIKEYFRGTEPFYPIVWYKVMQYLIKKSVPEQPITVEFHTGEKIDVYAVNVFEDIGEFEQTKEQ